MRTVRPVLALAALLAAHPAAPADDPTARGFDPDPTRPALSLDGGFTLETAATAPRGRIGAAFLLDWTDGLLALQLGDAREDVLASRLSAHLLAAASLGRLELGLDLPVALYQRSDLSLLQDRGVTGPLVAPIARSALGDVRLVAKLSLLEAARAPLGIGLAALLDLRAPTGDRTAFTGEGPMAVPGVVLTRAFGRTRLDAQVGYVLRERGQWAQLVVNDGPTWSLGGSYDLTSPGAARQWRAIAEVGGGWPRGNDLSTDRHRAPLSARTGLRAFLSDRLAVDLGAGTGLGAAGYGRESWRVFGGIRFALDTARDDASGEPDRDRDGVPDARDACPAEPGPAELDGCPDRDGDEIPDREDRCPAQPGPATRDGCPVKEEEPLVEIETERLSLKDAIQFDTGRDTLRSQSFPVLDAIGGILVAHPELRRVRVEGHTDDVGSNAYNKDLSDRRARTVARYLAGKGVARERLEPTGFGEEHPIASNKTALGRAKNRRVEFTILDGGEGTR
ncbi:OmpA family protein [Anaeromyxobacter terrae]|uniref:OmpA family protein n=1 Tax=Anaeromyxobacter terrae TaxID=2925406 RepID=UPI001F55B22F|nr:OmpA family protein [Anaeromyxobacter sp. SG22]